MSSSAELPDWSAFAERPVLEEPGLLSPASEMAAVLQQYHADLEAVRQDVEAVRRDGLTALARQASFVVQLAAALTRYESIIAQASLKPVHRHLRVIKDQMLDALREAGLEIVEPLGKPYREVSELVQVEGWRHHADFASEVVAEALEPIVSFRGVLVRPGRVVMGAPPLVEDAPAPGPGTLVPSTNGEIADASPE
jgi:hypothetical protein